MKRIISLGLTLILLATTAGPTLAASCQATYSVRYGDTLSRIGLSYGVPWPAIASANSLADANKIYVGQNLCIPGNSTGGGGTITPAVTGTIPTFAIATVTRDTSVTIQTANFPAGQKFDVLMGPMGTHGVNGTAAGKLDSGSGGALTGTFNIPNNLKGLAQISIRLQSSSGYFAFNWFFNNTYP